MPALGGSMKHSLPTLNLSKVSSRSSLVDAIGPPADPRRVRCVHESQVKTLQAEVNDEEQTPTSRRRSNRSTGIDTHARRTSTSAAYSTSTSQAAHGVEEAVQSKGKAAVPVLNLSKHEGLGLGSNGEKGQS
jgi:hypothetical protein